MLKHVGIKIFSREFNAAVEAAHKHFRGNPKKNEWETFFVFEGKKLKVNYYAALDENSYLDYIGILDIESGEGEW